MSLNWNGNQALAEHGTYQLSLVDGAVRCDYREATQAGATELPTWQVIAAPISYVAKSEFDSVETQADAIASRKLVAEAHDLAVTSV